MYVNQDYAQPTAHLRRYSLRLDGFASAQADYAGGELVTKPLVFQGRAPVDQLRDLGRRAVSAWNCSGRMAVPSPASRCDDCRGTDRQRDRPRVVLEGRRRCVGTGRPTSAALLRDARCGLVRPVVWRIAVVWKLARGDLMRLSAAFLCGVLSAGGLAGRCPAGPTIGRSGWGLSVTVCGARRVCWRNFPQRVPKCCGDSPWRADLPGPAVAAGRVSSRTTRPRNSPCPRRAAATNWPAPNACSASPPPTASCCGSTSTSRPYHISYATGPRATPTVDEDRVYALGAEGNLNCLRVADGTVVWSRDLPADYGFETPMWGCAGHPLIDGQKLILPGRR